MMARRSLLFAFALPLAVGFAALGSDAGGAQTAEATLAAPVLRANISVNSDVVLIGDVIENAGVAARIAIYRAPDLGTTGSLPVAKVLSALRGHRVIGVDTRDIREVMVTRLARKLDGQEIESEVLRALARSNGRADAANFNLKFDRDPQTLQLDPSNVGAMEPVAVRHDPRSGRFEISFEIANETGTAPTKLHFTGSAVETVEAAVLVRGVERNEVVKASDVLVERRPKAEVGEVLSRDDVIGMQARRALRAGQPLRSADIGRPDLVQRDQGVTLICETPGIYLTVRGKALENGAEGDVVNVLNLQSKRTVSGVVIGRGQVSISMAQPRVVASAAPAAEPALAAAPVARQPE
jgi:flagellar basal body P-ring formation protein FlgA